MTTIGLWIDDPAVSLRKPAYWDELRDHGVRTAALMLESVGDGFDPKYTLSDLHGARSHALARDIEIVLTVWPEPNAQYLDDLEQRIGAYLKAAGASGLEFDAESNWTRPKVKGFPNIDKAGDRLVKLFENVSKTHDVRIELTTFTMHTENSKHADIAPYAHRLLPQAYSVRSRTEGPIEWDAPHGPGAMQRLTLDRALAVPGEQIISVGLPAYDQVWPGKKGEDAMQIAFDAAMKYGGKLGPAEIRYWSSKWVIGNKKNGYASRFLKSIVPSSV